MWVRRIASPIERPVRAVAALIKKRKKTSIAAAVLLVATGAAWFFHPSPKIEKDKTKMYLTAEVVTPPIKEVTAKENPPLKILFSQSAAKIEQIDKELKTDALTIEPKIEGVWKWAGDKELVFTPKEDWPIKREYTVTFEPSFFPAHTILEKNQLTFATLSFSLRIQNLEFVSDPVDPERKTVVASLIFSHPVNKAELEKRIRMSYGKDASDKNASKYQFEVQYGNHDLEAYIHSFNIPIPMKDMLMTVAMEKGTVAAKGGPGTSESSERSVTVPGMYSYFRVDNIETQFARNKNNDPEQILVVSTTVDVHETEIKSKLKAWLLPEKNPAVKDDEAGGDQQEAAAEDNSGENGGEGEGEGEEVVTVETGYAWSAEEVDQKILKKSRALDLEFIPQEREYSSIHTLKFKADVGRRIFIRFEKGTKAWGGYILADPYEDVQVTPAYPAELAIMHEGALLSTAGARKISVMTRGLPGVSIELARVMKSEVNHLLTQTDGRFESPDFNYSFGPENISEVAIDNRRLDNKDPSVSQYTTVDVAALVSKHGLKSDKGLFILTVKAWDQDKYIAYRMDKRLVLITDLGIMDKMDAKGNHNLFVQSIATGTPKAGAEVAVIGKNGLPIIQRRTDADGLAVLPPLLDFVREKSPTAFMVTDGEDFSYLPVGRSDRLVDYSRFDVGGSFTSGSADNLSAYLFSDRGIYRPGDEFHVGLIVKAVDWSRPLDGLPIELVVTDPRGQEVLTQKAALEASGFMEMTHQTEESSPTGNYTVSASLLKKNEKGKIEDRTFLGSVVVRVEEFLPDSMTIKTAFGTKETEGWISPSDLFATVSLHNLYGTPASARRVAGKLSLSTTELSFNGYRDYIFHDPTKAESGYVKTLDDVYTDDNGDARFDIDLSEFASATYDLVFSAEGFEAKSGKSVTSESRVTVSPLKVVVGYKPDGGLSYINRGSSRNLRFVSLNNRLQQVSAPSAQAVLYERRYISTLVRQYNGTFKYQSVGRKVQLAKQHIDIGKDGLDYALKTDAPGDFILEVEAKDKVVLSRIEYSVAGEANLSRNLERTAELEVKLDKSDYAPGEEIQIHIKAPYKGEGLITIERDKVFAHKWFKAEDTSFVETITVPNNVDVNAYVNVAMIRSFDSDEIFMSPFTTAVVPFSLTREKKVNTVTLKVPELVKPGDEMAVEYSTASPTKIVVFGVDEGILQVADYKTPDPLSHFLSKRALEVATSQILDLIMPERDASVDSSSEGGDEEDTSLGRNLNPFKRKRDKPVVFWSGIMDAGPEVKTYHYNVPDYFNGTIRTMAVAVSPDKIGAAEKKSVVRGPFVIHSSLPLFAAPGDIFDVSVTVANNVEGSGKKAGVNVTADVTENLEIVGAKKQTVEIAEGKEKTVTFKAKAKPRLGNATLTFKATCQNQSGSAAASLSVRPKNPKITSVEAGVVKDGSASIPIKRRIYPEYRELSVSVSPLPLALADGLVGYLKEFPHGCTEQIVSQTIPSLVLLDHQAFGYNKKTATSAVMRTIRMLQTRQNSDGAFGYWAANSFVSDQQTVYATEFLTEAKARGYAVPEKMLDSALAYLKQLRDNELNSVTAARLRSYAVYVLALNGELSSASVGELREYLAEDKTNGWHRDSTLGYLAATYRLMQDRREAQSLVDKIDLTKNTITNYDDFYDDQVYRGVMLYLVAKHFPEALDRVSAKVIEEIAASIAKGNYSTLSSSRIILGLEAYGTRVEAALLAPDNGKIEVREVLSKDNKPVLKMEGSIVSRAVFSEKAGAIEISSPSDFPVFYQVSLIGFDIDTSQDVPTAKGVEVVREFRKVDKTKVDKVALGDEIEAVIKLRSISEDYVSHLAMVDLLPAGFEAVVNSEEPRIGTSDSTWSPEYVDIREDRVVMYGSVGKDAQTFVYRIKAESSGRFAVPPIVLTSMYDPKTMARTGSSSITVVENP
jgi:uncharacterized protein YfaS (alpha-2-macroglobulin family)